MALSYLIIGLYLPLQLYCLQWKQGSMELPTYLIKPAYSTMDEQSLYIFGGFDTFIDEYSYFIYKYNTRQHASGWMTLSARLPVGIQCYQCTAIINQTLIYIVTQYPDTIYIFDTVHQAFLNNSHITSPLYPLHGDGLSVTNDVNQRYMYVVSYDSRTNKTHLQMYDTITNQWSHLSTVPFVSFGQTSIVAYDNTIALFGGYYQNTGFPTEYLNCTCQYQISDDRWNCFSPHLTLSERKYGVSTVFDHHSNLIYILGGFGEDGLFSNKVNVFNPITNSMHNDTNLPNIGGGNLITSIMGRKMIVFGGWHATTRNIVKTSLIAKLISGHPTTQPPQTVPTHDSTVDAVYSKESGLVGEDIIILVSGCIIGVLLLFSVIYLLFFTAKRSREIGQISWTSFLKYSSVLLKITIVFGLLDSISHYIFATSLLGHLRFGEVHNASRITWMAWISLICGIVAFLLCICWLLVARKLYAKIPVLMKQLAQYQQIKDRSLNMDLRRDLLKEIRLRKVDIDIFGILIACLDITQITIILIVHKLWLKEWSTISIASLSLCFVSCSLKFVNIIIDGMGCGDDSMNVKHDTTHDRKGEHSDVAIAYEDDMDCMHEDLSDTDNIGHAAYERHISIIRSNVAGSEAESLVNEAFNVIQIQRNDHFKNDKNGIDHIIHNATTAMGIYHDEEEELGSRHIFLDGEGSPSQHSPQGQHNYIDL